MPPARQPPVLHWDLFCRIVDNFGDIGVAWRLAADLAGRGQTVRLWVDDPSALSWMAPGGCAGVTVWPWQDNPPVIEPGDVVVETFGCDPPPSFVAAMAGRRLPPLWLNLEYLSAESYVERSHRLPSPQWVGPGQGLTKWFFYPGFTMATGGLLREPGLRTEQARFDSAAWARSHGWERRPGERWVSLFCYEQPPLNPLLAALSDAPTLLLTAPGPATQALANRSLPTGWRHIALPWLCQPDYDRLLWSCDLNLVRGEDSFVRAQWAGKPFLWHIYPQQDGVQAVKLDAFLQRHLAAAGPALAVALRDWMQAWNGLKPAPLQALPSIAAGSSWHQHAERWRDDLHSQPDLSTQLLDFVLEKR